MSSIDLFRGVYLDERVYADTDVDGHKMGWIRSGDNVHLVEEYHGWYRLDFEGSDAPELAPPHNLDGSNGPPWDYNEWWVKDRPDGLFGPMHEDDPMSDPELEPEPDEEPELPPEEAVPSDAEIGRVIRFLLGR